MKIIPTFFQTCLLCAVILGLQWLAVPTAEAASFTNTGSMTTNRMNHTATLLPNGKVLVAGGQANSGYLSSAELYDPATGTWASTGLMNNNRDLHSATLLANGMVLVAGGYNNSGAGNLLSNAELYDLATGTWTSNSTMNTGRREHTATVLPNGKVLIAGGLGNSGYLSSTELYDPTTGQWITNRTMSSVRIEHTSTLLSSGKVLVAGGYNGNNYLSSAEMYDPATGIWTATGSMNTNRAYHTATLLSNGKVLVAGGAASTNGSIFIFSSAELYDPTTETWTATGAMSTNRFEHSATLLSNGKVLVAGGAGNLVTKAEMYDSASGMWAVTGSMSTYRSQHTATLLPNGKVLISGGIGGSTLSSTELYDSTNPSGYNQATSQLLSGSKVRLSFIGDSGANYALDRTFNLSPANWVPQATNPAGAGGVLVFTNIPNTATNNFWRIRSVP